MICDFTISRSQLSVLAKSFLEALIKSVISIFMSVKINNLIFMFTYYLFHLGLNKLSLKHFINLNFYSNRQYWQIAAFIILRALFLANNISSRGCNPEFGGCDGGLRLVNRPQISLEHHPSSRFKRLLLFSCGEHSYLSTVISYYIISSLIIWNEKPK